MVKNRIVDFAYRNGRRVIVGFVGGIVLLVGIALLVLPGPAFVVIPIGLGILSLEFAWPRIWLRKVRRSISQRSLAPLRAEDGE
jgi:tellurite resistance protein TerC